MSNYTGTWGELLFASTWGAGTAINGNTATEQNMQPSGPMPMLAANFWFPNFTQTGRAFHVVARGVFTTTTTAQPINFTLRATTTAYATSGGSIVLGTAAVTPAASLTTMFWELEGDVVLTTIGKQGANSTVQGVGDLRLQNAALASGLSALSQSPAYGGAASPGTVATVDTSNPLYLNMNALFAGTASASNTLTLQQLLVYGSN